jgi:multicomponent Na+:H+ antiporter subunit E
LVKGIIKFIALLGFWFILSGSVDWQHSLVGVLASGLIIRFWWTGDEKTKLSPSAVVCGLWLCAVMLVEIWRSAWHVALIILSGKRVDPEFVWVNTPLKSPLARVVLANCITLTPGTLTVTLGEDRLLVHALTHGHALALVDWRVHRILQKMEGLA